MNKKDRGNDLGVIFSKIMGEVRKVNIKPFSFGSLTHTIDWK